MRNSKTTESRIAIDVLEQWKEDYLKRTSTKRPTSSKNVNSV